MPTAFLLALASFAFFEFRGQNLLLRSCLGAAAAGTVWAAWLFGTARRAGRTLVLSVVIHRHHWVQALAQAAIYVWWGWHVRIVYAFVPLLVAQVLFAYAVDALLTWSRRERYAIGFGPLPVVGSINLFLWFRPEWFHWQFVMIAVGYLGKELIRWQRDGRSAHIFNPSSFPLALVSVFLVATGASDATFGQLIANTQHDPPLIYLVIFLAALPGQLLFGVARMTLAAVATMFLFSAAYLQVTGTYFFFDSHIPVPVFLGMHLLFTDPSTSPRSGRGRIVFGVLYALGILALYVLLTRMGVPTFYDKLLPVPLLNLAVRAIDRASGWRGFPLPAGSVAASPLRTHLVWTSAWVVLFLALSGTRALGDRHPGQYLPFWVAACQDGSARACEYASFLTLAYCNNGSGWACNEVAARSSVATRDAVAAFRRACELGFEAGCQNARIAEQGGTGWRHGDPELPDLPIVLRGTKPALSERDPARLYRIACDQGWSAACGRTS
ncbi:MAG: hypothetical protein R3E98_06340 [Gemmatimonadota bacterium]